MRKTPIRVLLVAMLAGGLGLTAEVLPAAASAHGEQRDAAVAQKKKKRKPAVKVGTTSLGEILVLGPNGHTLYVFDPDGTDTSVSHCTGGCADLWPPAIAKKARAGKGLDKAKLTLGVDNQLAYDGHLLYAFASDTAPGDTNGQGVGGTWYAIRPDGKPVGLKQ